MWRTNLSSIARVEILNESNAIQSGPSGQGGIKEKYKHGVIKPSA